MNFRNYNDYEIINLIKQGHEEALNLMVEKYKLFIAKKIGKFNLAIEYDDCFQEGLIILYKSVIQFDESYNKSFTRYFEHNLENRFISILRSRNRYGKFIYEKLPVLFDYEVNEIEKTYFCKQEMEEVFESFSTFEKSVFENKFLKHLSTIETANSMNCEVKKVYNAIDRIRQKLKMHLE
ncbi:MAG: sigma-70 family RNA polymerase sigma factor [Firmicutes bacterium]|nr:sigma-70 family RNA polymerase sigma factor [Bacillota bacterium]